MKRLLLVLLVVVPLASADLCINCGDLRDYWTGNTLDEFTDNRSEDRLIGYGNVTVNLTGSPTPTGRGYYQCLGPTAGGSFNNSNKSTTAFGSGDFTMELWLRGHQYTTDPDKPSVMGTFDGVTNTGTGVRWDNGDSDVAFITSNGPDEITSANVNIPLTNPGTWNHFAFTKNASAQAVYLNGSFIASSPNPEDSPEIAVMMFCKDPIRMQGYAWVDFNEVMIWEEARTAEEILIDMGGYNTSIPDEDLPYLLSNVSNTSSPHGGSVVSFLANWTDNSSSLSQWTFYDSISGTNASSGSFSSDNLSVVNFTVTATRGSNFSVKFYAQDSSGNWGEGDWMNFTVLDAPPNVTAAFPLNGTYNSSAVLLFEWVVDDFDGDVVECNVTVNGSVVYYNSSISGLGALNANSTLLSSSGMWVWNVTCSDGILSTTSETLDYIYDPTMPDVTFISPSKTMFSTNRTGASVGYNVSSTGGLHSSSVQLFYEGNRSLAKNMTFWADLNSSALAETLNVSWESLPFTTYYFNVTAVASSGSVRSSRSFNISKAYLLTVFANDSLTGNFITEFMINLTGSNVTRSNSSVANSTNVTFGFLPGVHDLVFSKSGYGLESQSISLNYSDFNYTFQVLEAGTAFFRFYYELNGSVFFDNVSLDFISEDYSFSQVAVSGLTNATNLSSGSWTLRYDAPGYTERFFFFDVDSETSVYQSLYLLDNGTASTVTVTVYDENSDPVDDAQVRSYKYDIGTNSYILQEMQNTNFEGEAQVSVEINSEFYKFLVFKPDGTLRKETTPSYIYSTTLTIYINLGSTVATVFEESEDIMAALVYQAAQERFKLTYDDPNSALSQMCLNVYRLTGSSRTLTNQSCSDAYGAILYSGLQNVSGRTYVAVAEVTIEGESVSVASLMKEFFQDGADTIGLNGLFIALLLCLTFAGLGSLYGPSGAIIMTPVPLVALSALHFVSLSLSVALSLQVVALLVGAAVGGSRG